MRAVDHARHALPEPCWLSKTEISDLAEDIARDMGYAPGDDLLPVVKGLGGDILFSDPLSESDSYGSGSIYMSQAGFEILLPLHTGPLRDRFTVAHELGHFILHYLGTEYAKEGQAMVADRYGSGRVETEANWFAASFLMPKTEFVDCWRMSDGDRDIVASVFRVSEAAARVRAQSLGL